jgi:nucleoside-diphosphate-sugar epimerase
MTKSMFIFGAGYTAGYLSKTLTKMGWTVYGTTRRQERFDDISLSGAHPLLINDPAVPERLNACSHVLISAGPGGKRRSDIQYLSVGVFVTWI